jgi:hypothetical protein
MPARGQINGYRARLSLDESQGMSNVCLRQMVVAIASEPGRFDESCGDYREVASIAVTPGFRAIALWIHAVFVRASPRATVELG